MPDESRNFSEERYKALLEEGLEYQDFVCVQLARHGIIVQNFCSRRYQYEVGENIQGVEIKLDKRFRDRLSIEIAEKKHPDNPEWTPSGIFRSDNSWLYVQGDYQTIFVFAKNLLINWYTKHSPPVAVSFNTLQKFYLPVTVARRLAALIIDVAPQQKT